MEKHFLQSEAWKQFQTSLGKQVFEQSGAGWSFLAVLESTPVGKYLYLPYGPTIRDKKAFDSTLKALRSLAKTKGAIFIRIEPTTGTDVPALRQAGFKKTSGLNPEHTWVLDLSGSKDAILAGMKQNNRNLFNNYQKKGLSIKHTTDPEKVVYLTALLDGVAEHNKIGTHSADYFRKQMSQAGATLYYAMIDKTVLPDSKEAVAKSNDPCQPDTTDAPHDDARARRERSEELDGIIIAAALVYDSPTTRYYAHAAADHEHRKLGAGTALVAQMIMDAKDKGLKTFDFYGITESENPHHPWYGFTKFKKSFGGAPLTYLGSWDLPIKKARYRAYATLRATNRKIRKALR